MILPKFILCRSDQGDGDWSLHAPYADDESIANGDCPPLVSGTARWNEIQQQWDRPNIYDYQEAIRRSP